MFWSVFLALIVTLLVVRRWKQRKLINLYNQLKTKKVSLPFLGHALHFLGSHEDQMKAYQWFGREAIKNNGMTAVWMGDDLHIVVADPELVEFSLKTFLEKGPIAKLVQFATGNALSFAPVAIWRPRRKIMAPTFNMKNLTQFVDIFVKQSRFMIQHLRTQATKKPFSVWPYINTYALDSVYETTMGLNMNCQMNHDHPLLKSFEEGAQLIANRIVQPWTHNDVIFKLLPSGKSLTKAKMVGLNHFEQIIKLKRAEIKLKQNFTGEEGDQDSKQSGLKPFLELLIESSGGERGYSDVELREESMMIVMAGSDTSAVGTSFATLMLAQHQSVQQTVYDEILEVFGESKRPVQIEDLPRFKYLDAVIKETLRLYPPGPLIVRHVDRDVTLPSGITLVKGCTIVVNIWATHRNPRYWGEDAEQFRPERFLDSELKHPAQFIPFSHGPRNCPGYQYAMMAAKVALSTLLREFRILPAIGPSTANCTSGQNCEASDSLRVKFNLMLRHVDNYEIKLESRV